MPQSTEDRCIAESNAIKNLNGKQIGAASTDLREATSLLAAFSGRTAQFAENVIKNVGTSGIRMTSE